MSAPMRYQIVCGGCGTNDRVYRASTKFCKPCMMALALARDTALRKVLNAVRTRKIPAAKLLTCVDCASPAQVYDHRDYEQPLCVEAVCKRCNTHRGMARWHATYIASSLKWRSEMSWPWHVRGRPALDVARIPA